MIVAALDRSDPPGAAVLNDTAGYRLVWSGSGGTSYSAWRPDIVAIELSSTPLPARATAQRAALVGAIQRDLARGTALVSVPANEWPPATLSGFVPGMTDAAISSAAQSLALKRFGVTVLPNVARAIAIACFVLANSRALLSADAIIRAATAS